MRAALRRFSIFPLLSLVVGGCATAGPTPGQSAPATPAEAAGEATRPRSPAEQVDSLMAEWGRDDSPGAVVGVIEDGEVVFAQGYGMANLAHGVPITPETRFNIGSISKQFTAFALALLESRGELSLDDPARAYLPELPEFDEEVTLRHLLTHTSGYRETYGMGALAGSMPGEGRYSREGALDAVARQPELEFAPGSERQYNSSAYVLLAMVVERVTGEPFPTWMEANVFEPLGMDDTVVEREVEQVIPGAADSYTNAEGAGYRTAFSNRAYWGAADIYTTVADLAKWLENFDTAELGGPGVRERMLERFVLTSGDTTDYALGIYVDEHRGLRRIRHGGSHAGFRASLSYFPELDAGVVFMSNYDELGGGLAGEVAEIFFGEHMEPQPEEAVAEVETEAGATAHVVSPELLAAYAGRYFSPELETFYTLRVRDGQLVAEHRWNDDVRLTLLEEDTFVGEDTGMRLEFERDHSGAIAGYRASLYRTTGVWFEKR